MRTIQKGQEPQCLTQHRAAGGNYSNYTPKAPLRSSLVAEQRGLCCYCQRRIQPNKAHMKIEHWQCQTLHPNRQIDYSNLLGACLGGHGRPKEEQHCDTHKGDDNLCICPVNPAHRVSERIKFLGNGEITSDEVPVKNALNKILNLNLGWLKANRKAVLDGLKERLRVGRLDPAQEISRWDGSRAGNLPEYSQVVVYYLNKKLQRSP